MYTAGCIRYRRNIIQTNHGIFFRYHCEKNGAGFAVLFSDTDDVSDEDAAWMKPGSCYAVTC